MSDALSKINTAGSAIGNWGKIVAVFFGIVGGGFLTYYQIQANSEGVEDNRQKIGAEIAIWGDRSDKRYSRANEAVDKFEKHIALLYERIAEIEKELAKRAEEEKAKQQREIDRAEAKLNKMKAELETHT